MRNNYWTISYTGDWAFFVKNNNGSPAAVFRVKYYHYCPL